MKKYLIILILGIALSACNNQNGNLPTDLVNNPNSAIGLDANADLPIIEFKKMEHDFGKVIQGEKVSYNFQFTNKGKADLLIANVSTSCGCTISSYPVEPVKSGETQSISVSFDSQNRIGFQHKRITVLTNATPAKYILNIQAEVIKPGQ